MKCDIKIMAHPKRRAHVEEMVRALGLDIEKDVFFGGDGGAMPTARKTWNLPFESDEITHRCVLQDDVGTCENFEYAINQMANAMPGAFFSLFCPRTSLTKVKPNGAYVRVAGYGMWGAANVIPRKHIKPLFDWVDEVAADTPHDDSAFSQYAKAHGIEVFTTLPNIVQHLSPMESLLGYNDSRKVSKVYYPGDARRIDWSVKKDIPCIYATMNL